MTALRQLLQRQDLAIMRKQCLQHGVSDERLATLVRQGTWTNYSRGIYLATNAEPGPATRLQAAVLAVGPPVAVARESALWWADRSLPPPRRVQLAVPRARRVRTLPGVTVLHGLRNGQRLATRPPAVVTVEDAVLDICAAAPGARQIEAVVTDAVRRRLTHPDRLLAALAARARHPHRRLLAALLREVEAGAQSPLELLDLRNDRRHGLPVAARQVRQRIGGQGRWLDAVLVAPGARSSLVKELDGRLGHEDAAGRFRDRRRDNDAVLQGRMSLRFGWSDLHDEPCEVAADTAAVLLAQGWRGTPRPCGSACRLPQRIEASELTS